MPIDLKLSAGGGRWVQQEKDVILSGSIPVGTPADTWVTVTTVNQECLLLHAVIERNGGSLGETSIRVFRNGVEFGEASSTSDVVAGAAVVGSIRNYSSNQQASGTDLPLHCLYSCEIQVKNTLEVTTTADGLYDIRYSKGVMS